MSWIYLPVRANGTTTTLAVRPEKVTAYKAASADAHTTLVWVEGHPASFHVSREFDVITRKLLEADKPKPRAPRKAAADKAPG